MKNYVITVFLSTYINASNFLLAIKQHLLSLRLHGEMENFDKNVVEGFMLGGNVDGYFCLLGTSAFGNIFLKYALITSLIEYALNYKFEINIKQIEIKLQKVIKCVLPQTLMWEGQQRMEQT